MPDEPQAAASGRRRPISRLRRLAVVFRNWLVSAVLLTAILTGAALFFSSPGVEVDLTARVATRLDQTGESWALAVVSGRDVTLSGIAPSMVDQRTALDAIADVWGVRTVHDASGLIPLVTPFDWAATKTSDGAITLSGHVPSEDVRDALHELVAANQPDGPVEDGMALARGAPPDFQLAAEYALRVLANLATGAVSLSATEVTASGVAADSLHFESAQQMVASGLPVGYALAATRIDPPLADPYVWSVSFIGDSAVIAGGEPTYELAQALALATATALPDQPVDDRSELASGAPEGFEAMVRYGLSLATHLVNGNLSLSDAALEIYGRAKTPEDYTAIQTALRAPPPAGLTVTTDITPALAPTYVFEAVRADDGVEMVGYMPSDAAHQEVLAAARALFPSGVSDRLQIADGAPRMDWISATEFALTQVSRLGSGSARIADHRYFVTGSAATSEGYEAVETELATTLPAGLELGESLVMAPLASPYRFAATVGPDAVTLSGDAPTADLRDSFRAAAELRFDPLPIAGEVRLASGAPVGFDAAVLAGLQAISRLEAGRMEVSDETVSVNGLAPHAVAVDRIEQQLQAALPAGFTLDATLSVKPAESDVTADVCQQLLTAELGTGTVKFAESSATIAPESQGRLDRLVAIVQRCPTSAVEIGGHTDSDGGEQRNLTLSQARAQAVVDYLVAAGVARDRLTAVGYGETRPIATNDTAEGRAQNRRIEFTIQQP